jgi:hypothetical protein
LPLFLHINFKCFHQIFSTMKFNTFHVLCVLMFAVSSIFAQNTTSSDDVYYNATSDGQFSLGSGRKKVKDYTETTDQTQGYDQDNGLEDDDYYYSKRVRRFRNSPSNSGYYDPRFTDLYNYDPYYAQSAFSFGNDYYRWNRMQMNRWNSYAMLDWNNPYCSPFSRYGYSGVNYYFPAMGGYGMGYGMGYNNYDPFRSNYGYYNNNSPYSNNNNNNNNSNTANNNPQGSNFRPRTDGAVRSAPRSEGRAWNEGTTVRPTPAATSTSDGGRRTPRQETATQGNWGGRSTDNGTMETPRRTQSPRQSQSQETTRDNQSYEAPRQSAPRSSGSDMNSSGSGGSSSGGGHRSSPRGN